MSTFDPADIKVDRSALSIGYLSDESDDKQYWSKRSPEERLMALELQRRVIYGYTESSARLQSFLEIAELKTS